MDKIPKRPIRQTFGGQAADSGKIAKRNNNLWLKERSHGIKIRKKETSVLQEHGVNGIGYAVCTHETYCGLFGASVKELKEQYGLPTKANWRDFATIEDLAKLSFTENLSTQKIQKTGARGNDQCASVCYWVARQVKEFSESVLSAKKPA